MSKGRRSPFRTPDVLKKLEVGRVGAIQICAGSRPYDARYLKAQKIQEAIDDMVEELTGDRELFWTKPHG